MADDLIPAAIRNGGAGSVAPGGIGPDYRQVQAPEQVRTDLPDSGAAARAAALGGLFKDFEGIGANIYGQIQTRAGKLAGAASGSTGNPQYKQGLARFTTYGRAFNNAATGAYAVQAEAQADDTAAQQRIQANKNPDTFYATYTATRDAVLKNAPADAVPMLTDLYNRHLAQNMAAIRGDQFAEKQLEQKQIWDEGVSRQTSRVALLRGSVDPHDQIQADEEQGKLNIQIEGGVTSGLYSKATAQAMHVTTMRQITEQVFTTQIDRELAKKDEGNVMGLMENFRNAHIANLSDPNAPPILSEDEYLNLMQKSSTRIREQRIMDMLAKGEGKTEEQLRFEAGDAKYSEMLLRHQLTPGAIADAVASHNLRPERGTSLYTYLLNGPTEAKSSPKALRDVQMDPNLPSYTVDDIKMLSGISDKDKTALYEEVKKARNGWEGTQAVKDARNEIGVALKLPGGGGSTALLSQDERKAFVTANQDFVRRMNEVEPAKRDGAAMGVAHDVIKAYQQKQAADEIQQNIKGRQNYMQQHGPGSPEPFPKDKFDARLKQYDDEYARLDAIAKGK